MRAGGAVAARAEALVSSLQSTAVAAEDGWLWLALYLEHGDGVVCQIEGEAVDPVHCAQDLARVIVATGATAYLARNRPGGRPTPGDRTLWNVLAGMVDPGRLVDMVVFDREKARSVREDAASEPWPATGGRGGS